MFLAGCVYAGEIVMERDPFSRSHELLKQSIKSRYVLFDTGAQDLFNLPSIEITGIMAIDDKVMATAKIESLGIVILKPGVTIMMKGAQSKEDRACFTVKKITANMLVIELKNGQELTGYF